LLGLDGSRVVVEKELGPEPGAQPWHARVNWEKHQVAPSYSPTVAVLYRKRESGSKSYLCKIEMRDYTSAYKERNAGNKVPAYVRSIDIEVVEQIQLTYDTRHRLSMIVEYQREAGKSELAQRRIACFYYDVKDQFLGVSFLQAGSCTSSGVDQIQNRYVYRADGLLLREISAEKNIFEPGSTGPSVNLARVTLFDSDRRPKAEYVKSDDGRVYRRSLAANKNDSQYHAIKIISLRIDFDLQYLLGSQAQGLWQFYSMPSANANIGDGRMTDRYLIARGESVSIDQQERERLWNALRRPDYDLVLEAQGVFLLVPEVSSAIWSACTNPLFMTIDACP